MTALELKLSEEERAKCIKLLRICRSLGELTFAVSSIDRDYISVAELYDQLRDVFKAYEEALHLLNDGIKRLAEADEMIGEMKHTVKRRNVPVAVTRDGLAYLTSYFLSLHGVLGCV
ncbi:MAG: hypothetical protein ACO2PN_08130 [Pyrobaculum sp.]|jgi:hypothetical protein